MRTAEDIPPTVFARGIELAKGATYMGVPLESLSREQLLAVAAEGWHKYTQALQRHINAPLVPRA